MSTCYLHIGTEKTGTSSIQNFLHSNSDELKEEGLWYAQTLGRPNNRKIAVYGRDPSLPDDGTKQYKINSLADHKAFQDEIRSTFEREVKRFNRSGCESFVVSSEHLHSRLLTLEMVRHVADLIRPHFNETKVLCYVRPQTDLALSLMSTAARAGHVVGPHRLDIGPKRPYYNYADLAERWSTAFGAENVAFFPFKRIPDTLNHFFTLFDVDPNRFDRGQPKNEALDVGAIAVLNVANSQTSPDYRKAARAVLGDLPVTTRLKVGKQKAMAIQARFRDSNATFCTMTTSVTLDDLEPDWNRYPFEGNLHLLTVPDHLEGPIIAMLDKLANAAKSPQN